MGNTESQPDEFKAQYKLKSFPGSALVDKLVEPCGNLRDTIEGKSARSPNNNITKFLNQAESLCAQSPSSDNGDFAKRNFDDEYEDFRKDHHDDDSMRERRQGMPNSPANPTSALFARALVSEVTDNPKTMTPAAMAEREYKLLKAQQRATQARKSGDPHLRPIGAPGGVGNPNFFGSIAHALTGSANPLSKAQLQAQKIKASVLPPNMMTENRAQVNSNGSANDDVPLGKHTITIGLCLSRRSSVGHPDTVTRQTAFDFNELQDREYKFVSSTDSSGWRAGGGERGGPPLSPTTTTLVSEAGPEGEYGTSGKSPTSAAHKTAAPDTVHIPIIHIDAESPQIIDEIIAALARGELFIPHMAVMPESLSVNGVSPPDLVVRFGTERNEDLPPDDWPNWCIEFMHNQLYEYFYNVGARWMKRPFSITLAKKVRWKTVKHMNKYFAHAERVIDAWREKGPQYLDPQLAYIEGGATPEEVARPHGIYLFRNGVPTNYFAPNFDPPYTTKMTRNLLLNVLGKSWDVKRREWTSEPVPRLLTPGMLVTAMCGCSDANAGGFVASEVTLKGKIDTSTIPSGALVRSSDPLPSKPQEHQQTRSQRPNHNAQSLHQPHTPAGTEAADTDIVSEAVKTPPSRRKIGADRQQQAESRVQSETEYEEGDGEGDDDYDTRSPTGHEPSSPDPAAIRQLHLHVSSSSHDDDQEDRDSTMHSKSVRSPPHSAAASPENQRSPQSPEEKNRYAMSDDPPVDDPGIDISMDTGVDSEAIQASVTNTNSTIMHTNMSTKQFMQRELNRHVGREEKKEDPETMASDDDWLDELGNPLASPGLNGQDDVQGALEKERERQMALVTMAHEGSLKDQENKPLGGKAKHSPSIKKNNSGVSGMSLDYSVDSTSFLAGDSTLGGSTLLGGKFATDASVGSSKGPSWTNSSQQLDPTGTSNPSRIREDDEVSGFSVQEYSVASTVVPSDEDLFAVGWAKALDPKSGAYYYFTLDRSQIVWDNPLGMGASSTDSAETESYAI